MNTKPATIRSAEAVRLPLSPRRPQPAPVQAWTGHKLMTGDVLAVMSWERRTYAVVEVECATTPAEPVIVSETFDGTVSRHHWRDLMASAGQAYAYFGQDQAQDPHVGRIVRADGTVHHITTAGYCLQCH